MNQREMNLCGQRFRRSLRGPFGQSPGRLGQLWRGSGGAAAGLAVLLTMAACEKPASSTGGGAAPAPSGAASAQASGDGGTSGAAGASTQGPAQAADPAKAAEIARRTTSTYRTLISGGLAPGVMPALNGFDFRTDPPTPDSAVPGLPSWSEVSAWLAANQGVIEQLVEATRAHHANFDEWALQDPAMPLGRRLRDLARVLRADASRLMERGTPADTDKAVERMAALFGMAHQIGQTKNAAQSLLATAVLELAGSAVKQYFAPESGRVLSESQRGTLRLTFDRFDLNDPCNIVRSGKGDGGLSRADVERARAQAADVLQQSRAIVGGG